MDKGGISEREREIHKRQGELRRVLDNYPSFLCGATQQAYFDINFLLHELHLWREGKKPETNPRREALSDRASNSPEG